MDGVQTVNHVYESESTWDLSSSLQYFRDCFVNFFCNILLVENSLFEAVLSSSIILFKVVLNRRRTAFLLLICCAVYFSTDG